MPDFSKARWKDREDRPNPPSWSFTTRYSARARSNLVTDSLSTQPLFATRSLFRIGIFSRETWLRFCGGPSIHDGLWLVRTRPMIPVWYQGNSCYVIAVAPNCHN